MEFIFLGLLILLMVISLGYGFPVAFSLPGSAIITVGVASLAGYFLVGDVGAYFATDGPREWLTAGVTNQRSLYWGVERDTLIAIPLFIFMGIMLQRSRVAEDLLVAMAQLFGPIPGGLGISVVFVGALLAATTGIVGATVIAMGMISLPAMMKNNYAKPLATGTICASGTLGQIIPPSIVLIILADQLSNAASQANADRAALYRDITGEFSMPTAFNVVSASAGDMFMGAMIPGLILVGIYMIFILVTALIKPSWAPPVRYDGAYDRYFVLNVFIALVPPLALVFIVLGSILTGVATVNQAGAIGAVGALMMASYRLWSGGWSRYLPAIIAVVAVVILISLKANFDLNIQSITNESDAAAIGWAKITSIILCLAVLWAIWRTYRADGTLMSVMIETTKTSAMVFIILLGAAMLTTAFRAFGGEELVREFLTSLSGGFWAQFLVVMLVIFILGFFLDFIEIAVVVVPIVAPILLTHPEANITAVWLGVMIGMNMQTSFLTPPFGFALFYLRGVASKLIKTTDIYKGASLFIVLQLVGLGIAGAYPSLINYLPNRTFLLSDNAPPPTNPALQVCVRPYVMDAYATQSDAIEEELSSIRSKDFTSLPEDQQQVLQDAFVQASQALERIPAIQATLTDRENFAKDYKPLHQSVRSLQSEQRSLGDEIERLQDEYDELRFTEGDNDAQMAKIEAHIAALEETITTLEDDIPARWETEYAQYQALDQAVEKAYREYTREADASANAVQSVIETIQSSGSLDALSTTTMAIIDELSSDSTLTMAQFKSRLEDLVAEAETIPEHEQIIQPLQRALGALSDEMNQTDETVTNSADQALSTTLSNKLQVELESAHAAMQEANVWRAKAAQTALPDLLAYQSQMADTIGIRAQSQLSDDQAKAIARCLSYHRDISLNF